MPHTKKSVTPVADLPIIETTAKIRKPRASRSKAAIAERAAAEKVYAEGDALLNTAIINHSKHPPADKAVATSATVLGVEAADVADDYSTVSDRSAVMQRLTAIEHGFPEPVSDHPSTLIAKATAADFDFVTPSGIDFDAVMRRLTAVEHGFPEPAIATPAITAAGIDANLAALSTAIHPSTDDKIDAAIAALEADGDDDPEVVRSLADVDFGAAYAETAPAPEEAAWTRLSTRSWMRAGAFVDLNGIKWEPGKITQLTITQPVIREVVDMLIALGLWVPPAGKEEEINEFWPSIRQVLIDSLTSASDMRLPVSDDTYTTLTSQHDRILALEGELTDAKAEVQRAEFVARAALRDGTEKATESKASEPVPHGSRYGVLVPALHLGGLAQLRREG